MSDVKLLTLPFQIPSIGGHLVRGDVTLPETGFTGTVIALQQGSTHCNRDGDTPRGHQPSTLYRRVARALASRGLAVIRHDKRQWDVPAPQPLTYSLLDRVADLVASVRGAMALPELAGARLLLAGHSEGGIIVQMAAPELRPAGLMVIAAPARGLAASVRFRAGLRVDNGNERQRGLSQRVLECWARLEEAAARERHGGAPFPFADFQAEAVAAGAMTGWESWPWLKQHFSLKMAGVVAGVACPALYIHGDHDRTVPVADIEAYRRLHDPAGSHTATFEVMPGLGHFLEDASRKAFVLNEALMSRLAEWARLLPEEGRASPSPAPAFHQAMPSSPA